MHAICGSEGYISSKVSNKLFRVLTTSKQILYLKVILTNHHSDKVLNIVL